MADMRRATGESAYGYTPVSDRTGPMMMDFGILRLRASETYTDRQTLEKAYLLVYGGITVTAGGQTQTWTRGNCFDDTPLALHVDENTDVTIRADVPDSEICILRTDNTAAFPPVWHTDTADEYRGAGLMGETSTRIVRTIFDKKNAPQANLVLGEVIGFPGKWSSYPPHHHPQPEIYYYKTCPENGFGYAELGDEVVKVKNNDTTFIHPGQTHPHCTAPGYALWYLWAIRHLPDAPYITPTFVDEHLWVLEQDAAFWPERKA